MSDKAHDSNGTELSDGGNVTGVLFSGDFSALIPEPSTGAALSTNAAYSNLFTQLGCGALGVGVALVLLIPFLRRLINSVEVKPPVGA